MRRSTGVVWLSLAFGSGVLAGIGDGPARWLPAAAVGLAASGGGPLWVGAAVTATASGWVAGQHDDKHSEPGSGPPAPSGVQRGLEALRIGLDARIEKTLGPVAAPLALALVSGRRATVPRSVRSEFSRAGTALLLAISGFHVGVVAGMMALLAALCGAGPRARTLVSAALVWGYVLMIGAPASGVRAAGLLTVLGCGRLMGRPTRRLPGLAAVFLITLALRPRLIEGIGFQLSFAASLGLLVTTTWPDRLWMTVEGSRVGRLLAGHGRLVQATEGVVRSSAVALGATLPTIPLVAWHFGTVSLVSVPATLMAMPLAAASIMAVLIAVVAGTASDALGAALGGGAASILALFELVVRGWASIPFAAVPMAGQVGLVGGAAAAVALYVARESRGLGTVAFAIVVGWSTSTLAVDGWALQQSDRTIEVVFVDVGQGDATLIRSPANRWVLVDAGPASATWDAGARRVVPFLAQRGVARIETLVLTHADADHVGGAAALLSAVQVGEVVDPGKARGSGPFLDALEEAARGRVPWRVAKGGDAWEVDGVSFSVLWPRPSDAARSANDDSVVLLVSYGDFEVLLTGDASTEVENQLLTDIPETLELLKVGHHGSTTSTSEELLARSRPRLAVVSAGARNRYGHPAPSVLSRLRAHGAQILRTDEMGTVRIIGQVDGDFTVSGQR